MAVALSSSSQKLMQEIYDQFLICKICFETYRKPKTLTCLHIFCTECLEKHMDAEVERSYRYMLYSRTVTCPVCRKKTDLPSGGIRRLPDNFLVANLIEIVSRRRSTGKLPQCEICKPRTYHQGKEAAAKCLECSKLLCTDCVELHRRTKVTRGHSLIDTQVEKSIGCKVHQDEIVRFYCEPCEMCICVLCTFQEHKGHNVQSFTEGIQKYQHSLDGLVTTCRDRITCVKEHLDMIKACESEIRKAEDQIRDATIESISAIRQSEKQQVEELYEIFGEDTIQFLKEKHVLQDILDNLTSSCSLTEIILKDKSIELLLLRREIQDKLEVLLQGRVLPPPKSILRHVTFNPGQIIFGHLVVDGENAGGGTSGMVAFRANSCDSGVQTNWEDWDNSSQLQTDDDKLGCQPSRSDSGVNTCPPDCQNMTTMTDNILQERTSVQTEAMSLAEKGIGTYNIDSWSQFTNTPTVQFVDRSTLTTRISMSDSHTETKGLIDYRSTICGPDLQPSQNMGTITEPPDVRSKSTGTVAVQLADKKIATSKLITHDIGVDPVKVNTHDFGVMTKAPRGVEKGIGTKTIVQSDMSTGSDTAMLKTVDAGTDTIWKGIRRVRHKATMHELLFSTQETDTDNLITTQERASSPCPLMEDLQAMISPKRKSATVIPGGGKRACTSETQTDLNLQTLTEMLSGSGDFPPKAKGVYDENRVPMRDRGTSMASCVRVTDIGTGTVRVRIIDRGINTKTTCITDAITNTSKVGLVESQSGTHKKVHENTGITTATLEKKNKETSTVSTKMKDKGTETFIQSVEKATYMIQPVILSTGTNTPMVHTSDKKLETDFDEIDTLNSALSPPVQAMANAAAATTLLTRDPKRPATTGRDISQGFVPNVVPVVTGQSSPRGERDMMGVPVQDAATSTLTVETENKETSYEPSHTSNRATMTVILMSDIEVPKRQQGTPGTLSAKRIRTKKTKSLDDASENLYLDRDEYIGVTGNASGAALNSSKLQSTTSSERNTSPLHQKWARQSEKNTATFKVELKSTGVGTPIINFHDRECSPIRLGMFDQSTSMSNINLSKDRVQPQVTELVNEHVLTTDRGCSPIRFPEGKTVPKVKTEEKGSSPIPATTKDCGAGTAHIVYYEKETCTPKIRTMHKNMATENIRTADKQTATIDITATYRGLFAPQTGSVITVSRGTCTGPTRRVDRETSPIKSLPFQVDTGTNPVRKVYVNKGVSVTKADLTCPVDKFHRAGQTRQRILPKNMPVEEIEPKFEPMATIQETSSDDEAACGGSGNSSPGCSLRGRIRLFEGASCKDQAATTHCEKLWLTAPRFGNGNNGSCASGAVGDNGGCSGAVGRAGCTPPARNQGDHSTFSANGSTQTSSILCKVETGTSTPPVEMEDKAMCTESISVDGKITECISKLRAVSQRLEAQTTSIVMAEGAAASSPIYSKADSFRRESLTTQATSSPVLSKQVLTSVGEADSRGVGSEREGLAPLINMPRRTLRRQGGRLGDMEAACPPFLARRELHSIDTGMVGGANGAGAVASGSGSSGSGGDNGNGSQRSKARKQRLDMTQLLHRPLGAAAIGEGAMTLPSHKAPYRPSLSGLKLGSLDECGAKQSQLDSAHRRLRAKMSAMESPEEEHAPATPSFSVHHRRKESVDSVDNLSLKQRSERPRLENMLGSMSSSSSTSPTNSPKTDRQSRSKPQTKPSPPSTRKIVKDKTSKSRSPPEKRERLQERERRESNSSDHKGVCCGLAGSPRIVRKQTIIRGSKKSLKEIGRLQKATSASSCSSSSTDDGRDSPGDPIRRRSRKDP